MNVVDKACVGIVIVLRVCLKQVVIQQLEQTIAQPL